ncbi:TolC family protein [Burkholderia anthina]|uniref:TolC family protein n=1 Tax=Burkholderia anthina TaxID=179879 RepID=UPI00158AC99F
MKNISRKHNSSFPTKALVLACGLYASVTANAMSLPELWELAQSNAPAMHIATATRHAGDSRKSQARALWRPDVTLTGSAGYGDMSSDVRGAQFSAPGFGQSDSVRFGTDANRARTGSWGVQVTQPLLDPQRTATKQLLDISATEAELQWRVARDALMLDVISSYFQLALASQKLRVLKQQQEAVEHILKETKERFRLGDSPITDVHEAEARAQAVQAQVLVAETDLNLRQHDLINLTQVSLPPDIARLPQELQAAPAVGEMEPWHSRAMRHNPKVLLLEQNVAAVSQQVKRLGPLDGTTLDLVLKAGGEHSNGQGAAERVVNHGRQAWVGLQLTIPLSTSGLRSAQQSEAIHALSKAQAEQQLARQQIMQEVRTAWLGLTAGSGRVKALDAAALASQAQLDATRVGLRAGDRNTLDLLNAEHERAAALLSLDEARVQLTMHRLRLDALTGQLTDASLAWAWDQTSGHAAP